MNDDTETLRDWLSVNWSEGSAALDRLEAELTRANDHFNEAVQERDAEVEKLWAAVKESKFGEQVLASEFADLEAENERLQGLYDDAKEALNEEYAVQASLRAEVERLRGENSELRKAFESDEYAIEQAAEVERLRETNDEFVAKHNALADDNQRLTNEAERLRGDADVHRGLMLKAANERLQREAERLRKDYHAMEQSKLNAEMEVRRLRGVIEAEYEEKV